MNSPDLHTIDDYLLNRLEGAELEAFEKQLTQDQALADEVAQHRKLMAAVDVLGDLSMKERVRKIHYTEMNRPDPTQTPNKTRKWAIVTVLVLLTAFGLWTMLRPKQQAPAQLYAAYYEPYNLNFGSRSTESEQILAEAGGLYKSSNFAQALPLFEQALSTDPADSKARLALGICQLELGQYDQALAQFNGLMDANDPLFGEQAQWYAALTKLRQGDIAGCKALLEGVVSNKDSQFYEKAKELLNSIK
jgi:tetratricopeptide (TPR) repeat protein